MLENDEIKLRVIEEEDIKYIKKWHNDFEISKHTTLTAFTPRNTEEEINWYKRKITDTTSRFFMIEHKVDLKTFGFMSFSNLDYRNQKVLLSIVLGEEEYRGKGLASQALSLFGIYLKNEYNIRKCSVQILEGNKPSLALFKRNGYIEEGVLKKEIFRAGEFQDLHILSKFL
ncbi:GNAT family N-acetyltransferase [Alkalihalobacillus trypoxylicola]|uniref:N-acetyltransferase domain-containing protein n=1 Tax=Alkalihalobacillus trypoxylicola TaxID=519424 RepID=A0A161PIX6_9BACI|nr:GNAT family protein [Alkalihalobacillus trypoxylicola]KYG33710.1 hypothetical protein AZF04_15915 [Alkalihalobacillus trypoxylicola]